MIRNTTLKQCRLCPNVTEDARYVRAIGGWKCSECDSVGTNTMPVLTDTIIRKIKAEFGVDVQPVTGD